MGTNLTGVLKLCNKGLPSYVTRCLYSGRCTTFKVGVSCCHGESYGQMSIQDIRAMLKKNTPWKINMKSKNGKVWKMMFLFNWMILRFQPLIFTGVCQKNHEINSLSSPRPRRRVVSSLHRGRYLVLWAPPREPGAGTVGEGPSSNREVLRNFLDKVIWFASIRL